MFAAGLKDSLNGSIDERLGNDLIVTSDSIAPLSTEVGARIAGVPGVGATTPQYVDQVEVDGDLVDSVVDILNGFEPVGLRKVYRFDWLQGSDAVLSKLRAGQALVESSSPSSTASRTAMSSQ